MQNTNYFYSQDLFHPDEVLPREAGLERKTLRLERTRSPTPKVTENQPTLADVILLNSLGNGKNPEVAEAAVKYATSPESDSGGDDFDEDDVGLDRNADSRKEEEEEEKDAVRPSSGTANIHSALSRNSTTRAAVATATDTVAAAAAAAISTTEAVASLDVLHIGHKRQGEPSAGTADRYRGSSPSGGGGEGRGGLDGGDGGDGDSDKAGNRAEPDKFDDLIDFNPTDFEEIVDEEELDSSSGQPEWLAERAKYEAIVRHPKHSVNSPDNSGLSGNSAMDLDRPPPSEPRSRTFVDCAMASIAVKALKKVEPALHSSSSQAHPGHSPRLPSRRSQWDSGATSASAPTLTPTAAATNPPTGRPQPPVSPEYSSGDREREHELAAVGHHVYAKGLSGSTEPYHSELSQLPTPDSSATPASIPGSTPRDYSHAAASGSTTSSKPFLSLHADYAFPGDGDRVSSSAPSPAIHPPESPRSAVPSRRALPSQPQHLPGPYGSPPKCEAGGPASTNSNQLCLPSFRETGFPSLASIPPPSPRDAFPYHSGDIQRRASTSSSILPPPSMSHPSPSIQSSRPSVPFSMAPSPSESSWHSDHNPSLSSHTVAASIGRGTAWTASSVAPLPPSPYDFRAMDSIIAGHGRRSTFDATSIGAGSNDYPAASLSRSSSATVLGDRRSRGPELSPSKAAAAFHFAPTPRQRTPKQSSLHPLAPATAKGIQRQPLQPLLPPPPLSASLSSATTARSILSPPLPNKALTLAEANLSGTDTKKSGEAGWDGQGGHADCDSRDKGTIQDGLTQQVPGTYRCMVEGCKAPPFQTQYLLNSHANVHSSARPHYCPVENCPRSQPGKGFKRKNEMIRHGLVHQSPGYVCPFCEGREHKYPRPDNLLRHVKVHHKDRSKEDDRLREVLSQRLGGAIRNRRRRQ